MLRVVALALVGVLTLAPAPVLGQNVWRKFDSKPGQFTVEMPGKPTIYKARTRKGVGGDVKTIMVGCEGEAGLYLVYQIRLPTAIVQGSEDAELDAERDSLVKEWNGKVLSERRIRAGNSVGRDFTVRGVPFKGKGTITIRIREYLADKAVYIVGVGSLPNRELPDDTGRFLGSLAIGPKRVRAAGSPAPEQTGDKLADWGVALDPLKDCTFRAEKDRLQMIVTGSRHQKAVEHQILNAPRVMREVEGDFVVTVKVVGTFRPGGRSTNPKSVPFFGAGILVYSDPDNLIRLERAAVARRGRVHTYVNFEEFEGGTRAASHNEAMRGGNCWLRMERQGSKIHGAISFDGTTWKNLKPIQTVWPAKLKIGLLATSSSSLPFAVAFEQYELKEGTK